MINNYIKTGEKRIKRNAPFRYLTEATDKKEFEAYQT